MEIQDLLLGGKDPVDVCPVTPPSKARGIQLGHNLGRRRDKPLSRADTLQDVRPPLEAIALLA
jgi:hypothetical protein